MSTTQNGKRGPRVALLCLAVVVIAILGLWRAWSPMNGAKDNRSDSSASNTLLPAVNSSASNGLFRIISEVTTGTGSVYTVSKGGQETRVFLPSTMKVPSELLEKMAFGESEMPKSTARPEDIINPHLYFYGKVVDELTNDLAGATIEVSVQTYDDRALAWNFKTNLATGSDGLFTVDVVRGQTLNVKVGKRPNYIDHPAQTFKYGFVPHELRHTPELLNPVLFVLHKRKPPEPLFSFASGFRSPNTGEPVRIDLATGKIVKEGGDLIISTWCLEPYTEMKRFPWKMSILAVNGGLIQIPSNPADPQRLEYLHAAPIDGYNSGFSLEYGPNTESYRVQHDAWYFIRSRGGQIHAKLYFFMNTYWDERGVPFRIEAVVNTNASRNLQTPVGQ